jgi:hypothetical protein
MVMEKIKDSIFKMLRLDNLVENLSGYFEARVALVKLEVREEISRVLSHALTIGALLLLGLLFVFFLSMGLAHYLNTYLESMYAGFWIVTAIYGVPCLLIYLFRKQVGHYFEQHLIAQAKRKQK